MTFSQTYFEARDRFRAASAAAHARLTSIAIDAPDLQERLRSCAPNAPPVDDHDLTIDVAEFGDGPKTLFVSSGVHGVEGFAGSAMQLDFLERGLPSELRVVLVHAVNPYGMAVLRRTNENNVDLNRNFLTSERAYAGVSDGYRSLYSLLHPQTPFRGHRDGFLIRAGVEIMRHGMQAVQQAVAGGQYEYPQGLFWGGKSLQPGPRHLLERLPTWLAGTEHLVALDLHTGLGRRGTYALRTDLDPEGERLREVVAAYGPRVQAVRADESATYEAKGGFIDAIERAFEGRCDTLVAEFGTRSALSVIKAMRAENQAHFFGGDVRRAKLGLRRAFYPESEGWRRDVLLGARAVIGRAVTRLRAL